METQNYHYELQNCHFQDTFHYQTCSSSLVANVPTSTVSLPDKIKGESLWNEHTLKSEHGNLCNEFCKKFCKAFTHRWHKRYICKSLVYNVLGLKNYFMITSTCKT